MKSRSGGPSMRAKRSFRRVSELWHPLEHEGHKRCSKIAKQQLVCGRQQPWRTCRILRAASKRPALENPEVVLGG